MTSMRKLRRRHLRWVRYVAKARPRRTAPLTFAYPPGWARTDKAVWALRDKRRPVALRCLDCGLPDPYEGHGDGIGSCDCPRCQSCGAGPLECDCGNCEGYEDDEPAMRVEDELAFQKAGLL